MAYRQTLARPVDLETRYIKQTGGRGKFAVINMRYEPLDAGAGSRRWAAELAEEGEKPDPNNIYFVDEISGGVVPKEYIPSVEDGFRDAAQEGDASTRSRSWTWSATLLDGKYHDVDSSQDAFNLAAVESFRDVAAGRPASRCWSRS